MKPIPTLVQLQEAIKNDFKSRLNLSEDDLKKVLNAFDAVSAAQFKLIYLFLSDIEDNVFPDNADTEANGGTLERQGRIWLGRNPLPATTGVFKISVTGVAGSVLRDSLTFKSNEGSKNPGQVFVLDSEYTLTGTDDEVEIRSIGAGTDYDLNVNDTLTITEPVIGVNQVVSVSEIVEQPLTQEDIEVYRQNVILTRQLEPQGGARSDYRLWAADAQGVRTVYPYLKDTDSGTVEVYVEATPENSTDGNGTPSGTIIDSVEDVLLQDPDETKPDNERGRLPIQATADVKPIVLAPVTITITGLSIDSPSIRQAIFDNIKSYLYTVRPYIPGADIRRNRNDVLYSARVQSIAIDSLDSGNFFSNLSMFVYGVQETDYQFDLGVIPYLSQINYE